MAPSILLAITIGQLHTEPSANAFTPKEADQLVTFWNQDGRIRSEDLRANEPFAPTYSPAASAWLYDMYKLRDPNQPLIPTKTPVARTQRHKEWDAYIDQQYSQDYAWAVAASAWLNNGLTNTPSQGLVTRPTTPIPADLKALAGEPPPFFVVHRAQRYTISFEGYLGIFEEGVEVPRKYPFLRSAVGTVSSSTPPNPAELSQLATSANVPKNLIKPLLAVAQLEGGFDTINTYDTGGISLGIIQFASLQTGRGSLATLLNTFKSRYPTEFAANFRRYGVDISSDGRLTVIDPRTGFENSGADAVRVVVEDKRLTAVFQRAAKLSSNFRASQLRLLAEAYNPARLSIPVTLGNSTTAVPVSKFITSEAGLATLMDRLVNRGNLDPLAIVVTNLAKSNNIKTVSGLASLEKEIIAALTYRHDFLLVATLTQPTSRPESEITGSPTGAPTTQGSIGNSTIAKNGMGEPTQVPPFDPSQIGKVSSQNSTPNSSPGTTQTPAQPPVTKDPTPTKPAGPITIPGG